MKNTKKYRPSQFFIWFSKITAGLPVALVYHPKVYYENRQAQGIRLPNPCIVMSNHTAFWDFILYELIFYGQYLRFLVGEVLFNRNPMLNWVLCKFGCIRVERENTDFGFMAECLKVLDKGGHVVMFPQGRLPQGDKPFPFKPGIVYIALHTDAPIIPVYTDGRYGFTRQVKVMIGEPIDIHSMCSSPNPSQEEILDLTKRLEDRIYELKEKLEQREAK